MAVFLLEWHCPVSMTSMVNKYDTEVPQVLDSDLTTCLTLDANAGQWMQISLPYIRIKGQFYVSLMGKFEMQPNVWPGCFRRQWLWEWCVQSFTVHCQRPDHVRWVGRMQVPMPQFQRVQPYCSGHRWIIWYFFHWNALWNRCVGLCRFTQLVLWHFERCHTSLLTKNRINLPPW